MRYLLFIVFLFSNIAFAAIGTISSFKGSVQIQRENQIIKPFLGLNIEENDTILTKNNSNIIIKFNDTTVITIGKNSTLIIEEYIYDSNNTINSKTSFNFLKGTFKSVTGIIGKIHPEKFKLRTKTANIGIRGTIIIANQEIVACTLGKIEVLTKQKKITLLEKQYTRTLDKMNIPLTLDDEIINILYDGLSIDIYRKEQTQENKKLILLEDILKKAVSEIKMNGDGKSGGDNGAGH